MRTQPSRAENDWNAGVSPATPRAMNNVILFDGVCNFCNSAVNWIIAHDPEGKLKFAPLQSEFGEQMRSRFGIADDVDSII
ncbi:MAG: DUF393 domain-containing protein, partial [Acidobacteria bacterium]|nr:DUF393 domain-containing protein [Acidobacteriota bacterium]